MIAPLRLVGLVALLLIGACGPRWTLEDRTTARDLSLDAKATHVQTVTIEASHPIATVRTVAEGISVKTGKLRVAHADNREGCSARRDFEGREGKWNPVPASDRISLTDDRLELSAPCTATNHAAQVSVSFTNEGDEPVRFRWYVVAIANGDGSDDPPDDAFVRVRAD
jgi:hypothetical protein